MHDGGVAYYIPTGKHSSKEARFQTLGYQQRTDWVDLLVNKRRINSSTICKK